MHRTLSIVSRTSLSLALTHHPIIISSKSLKGFFFSTIHQSKVHPLPSQVTMVAPKSKDATPSGSKPTRGWDAAAHEALLLCVIDEIKGGKAFLTEVTRRMQERGYHYSYDAIKYLQATFYFFPSLVQQKLTLSSINLFFFIQEKKKMSSLLTSCVFSSTLVNMFKSCARLATSMESSPRLIRPLLEPPRVPPLLARRRLLLASAKPKPRRKSMRTTRMTTSSSSWSWPPRTM